MLRRTGVAKYPYERMVTLGTAERNGRKGVGDKRKKLHLKELLDPLLMPNGHGFVEDLPEVNLNAELTDLVQHGMPVQVAGAPAEGTVRMTSGEEKLFVGVAQIAEDTSCTETSVVFRDEEPQA